MPSLAGRRATVARFAIGAIAICYAVAALVVAAGPGGLTTYAGESAAAAGGTAVAGMALVAAGLSIHGRASTLRLRRLAVVAGFIWFAPIWVGWAGGPSLVRSVAMVVAGFELPVLWYLVLAYPSGGLESKATLALLATAYLEAALSAVGRALFRDPFFDPNCWSNCIDNAFLVRSIPSIGRGIQIADLWFAGVAAVGLIILCVRRFGIATGPARRALWPITAAGVVIGAATVAYSILLADNVENPRDQTFLAIFFVQCVGVILVAVGLMWNGVRAQLQRRSVARIVANLGVATAPGSLQAALAAAIGDPELRIAYWLPDPERWVDAHGVTVEEPAASDGRMRTTLALDGRRIAVVDHAASVPELEPEFGAAVRLALDNERLQADVLSQVSDLRASRARIVETRDAERRRLEHDLHDGAQQRLLALSYDLHVASAAARAAGDADAASLLAHATGEAQAALEELRDLAHGIYPAILSEAGVASAIETLADTAPLDVEIEEATNDRFQPAVEMAMYLAVSEAIEDAAGRSATSVTLKLVRDSSGLVLYAADDGSARTSALIHLADRIGALGGRLELAATSMRAEVPCG